MKKQKPAPKFNLTNQRPLVPITMRTIVTRPGALDILSKPSRIGNSLFHTNGAIEKITEPEAP